MFHPQTNRFAYGDSRENENQRRLHSLHGFSIAGAEKTRTDQSADHKSKSVKSVREIPPIEANGNDPQKEKKFPIESQGVQPNKTKRRMRLKSVKYGFRSELFGINGPNDDKRHEKQGRIERYAPHFAF